MMWLKYAGTIEIITALSCMHEKVPPLGKPQLHIEKEMRCYTWVAVGRGEEERRNKNL